MGLFEPTFLRVKVTRGAMVCCLIQIVFALVISIFPIIRIINTGKVAPESKSVFFEKECEKQQPHKAKGWKLDDYCFRAFNITILVAITLLTSAILILIGNSKKRYLFFIPALIVQVAYFVFTVGAIYFIATEKIINDYQIAAHYGLIAGLCVALLLQYVFTVFYAKSFHYLRIFRT